MQGYCEIYQVHCEFAKDDQYKNGCDIDGSVDCGVLEDEIPMSLNEEAHHEPI